MRRLVFHGVCLALVCTTTAPTGTARVADGAVGVYRLSDVPAIDLVPGVHVRTVVGTTGSFSIGDFDPGSAAVLHHHTREQADIAIAGEFDMTVGDRVEKLRPGFGVIVPADVPHSIANNGGERRTVVEFHTVRRPDLVPPRPAMTFPASETPAILPGGVRLIQPLPRTNDWIRGRTCLLGWRELASGARSVTLAAGAVERFEYVARGLIELASGERRARLEPGSLLILPARTSAFLQSIGSEAAALAEFIPGASEK